MALTGKPRDYESGLGLDYFGARYFSGAQGRFTSPDPFLGSGRAEEPQSWNRYVYAGNNPLRFIDPTGLDYYDQNGNRIGTDGNTDGNDYVVTDAEQIELIRRNNRTRGGTTALDQVGSAILMPGATVRAAIGDAVGRSNAPSDAAGDQQGGSHEEGGAWGLNAAGNQIATPAAPGAFADLRQPGRVVAQIDPALAADPARQNDIQTPQGVFHVHPRAQVTMPDGTIRVFNQFPSGADIGAAASMNIVVGARDRTVYFYNGGGQRATIPLNRFLRLPR